MPLTRGKSGADGRTRTDNRLFTRQVRYQLRHASSDEPAYRPVPAASARELQTHPGTGDEDRAVTGDRPPFAGVQQGGLPPLQP